MSHTNQPPDALEIKCKIEELKKERESGGSHFSCYLKALDIFCYLCNGDPESNERDLDITRSLSRKVAFDLKMELEYFVNSIVDEKVKEKWKKIINQLKMIYSR